GGIGGAERRRYRQRTGSGKRPLAMASRHRHLPLESAPGKRRDGPDDPDRPRRRHLHDARLPAAGAEGLADTLDTRHLAVDVPGLPRRGPAVADLRAAARRPAAGRRERRDPAARRLDTGAEAAPRLSRRAGGLAAAPPAAYRRRALWGRPRSLGM